MTELDDLSRQLRENPPGPGECITLDEHYAQLADEVHRAAEEYRHLRNPMIGASPADGEGKYAVYFYGAPAEEFAYYVVDGFETTRDASKAIPDIIAERMLNAAGGDGLEVARGLLRRWLKDCAAMGGGPRAQLTQDTLDALGYGDA